MSDNVIALSQHFKRNNNAIGNLTLNFAANRRDQDDVFWLKENAEILSILECTGQKIEPSDLACYQDFYDSLPERIAFFPQYYRFLTSIALDLEALGLRGQVGEQLCTFVDQQGLAKVELSDLQRAEATRLLARRQITSKDDTALRARLHAFMDHSASFALPNRKAAYELTHIVFYLSEYGRRDPELSEKSVQSLMFIGILAHLEQNADLLSEVCVALRYAGETPPRDWETWITCVVRDFERSAGHANGAADHYHEYLVANWACAQIGASAFSGPYASEGVALISPVTPMGAMRALSQALFELDAPRRSSWAVMQLKLEAALPEQVCAHLASVAAATSQFEVFFEKFARVEMPRTCAPAAQNVTFRDISR